MALHARALRTLLSLSCALLISFHAISRDNVSACIPILPHRVFPRSVTRCHCQEQLVPHIHSLLLSLRHCHSSSLTIVVTPSLSLFVTHHCFHSVIVTPFLSLQCVGVLLVLWNPPRLLHQSLQTREIVSLPQRVKWTSPLLIPTRTHTHKNSYTLELTALHRMPCSTARQCMIFHSWPGIDVLSLMILEASSVSLCVLRQRSTAHDDIQQPCPLL